MVARPDEDPSDTGHLFHIVIISRQAECVSQLALDRLLNPAPGSRIEAAKKFCIERTLLISQLRLTPAERARQMREVCQIAENVRGAGHRRKP